MISPDEAPNTIFASRGPNVGLTAEVAARTVWDDIPSQGGDFARDEHHALTPRAVLIKVSSRASLPCLSPQQTIASTR